MDRREKDALDRWITTEPDWSIEVDNEEIHDWGMTFIGKVDEVVQKPGNESLRDQWMDGDWGNDLVRLCREVEPDITEEQLEWVEQFLSEI